MRVVIDTNVLVSFAIRPNPNFRRMFDYLVANGDILVCQETLDELSEVLTRDRLTRYFQNRNVIEAYIAWYESISDMVEITNRIVACSDPKDDKFLSLAVDGRAHYIIAGDKHIKDMIEFRGVPIYSPTQFIHAKGITYT